MKLAISNIAWSSEYDETMYSYLKSTPFTAIEIAPTRIFSENPYQNLEKASRWSQNLSSDYGLSVCSMQSIWFGKSENIFQSDQSKNELFNYTKSCIEFAQSIQCNNIVFGCPKNRNNPTNQPLSVLTEFLALSGEYAENHNTVFAIEANPDIYGTNTINGTESAFEITRNINSKGLKVNLDLGTIIYNKESIDLLEKNIDLINHVHISEPYLELIQKRTLHFELFKILNSLQYEHYLSIEMKNQEDLSKVKQTLEYIGEFL